MFKNRPLAIALLISTIWHLVWMSAVTIIIVPESLNFAKFPPISFLGPVLDEAALKITLKGKSKSLPTAHKRDSPPLDELRLEIQPPRSAWLNDVLPQGFAPGKSWAPSRRPASVAPPPRRRVPTEVIEARSQAERVLNVEASSQNSKEVPRYRLQKELMDRPGSPIQVQESVEDQTIPYKPLLLSYPEWADQKGLDFDVEIESLYPPGEEL